MLKQTIPIDPRAPPQDAHQLSRTSSPLQPGKVRESMRRKSNFKFKKSKFKQPPPRFQAAFSYTAARSPGTESERREEKTRGFCVVRCWNRGRTTRARVARGCRAGRAVNLTPAGAKAEREDLRRFRDSCCCVLRGGGRDQFSVCVCVCE